MVVLPFGFTATKYPGYFWDTRGHCLYSIKIGGELRKVKMTPLKDKWWNSYQKDDAYRVSHKGRNCYLYVKDLMKLKVVDSTIPCRPWGC